MNGWRLDYCCQDTDAMVSAKDKNFPLICGNHRVSINANVIFSLLAMPPKPKDVFSLTELESNSQKKNNTITHHVPERDSILSISGHGDHFFLFGSYSFIYANIKQLAAHVNLAHCVLKCEDESYPQLYFEYLACLPYSMY